MDRMMVYAGAIPLETDILTTERNVMSALGWTLQGLLGTTTVVDGFTCVQTTVPSQSVQVTAGQILTLASVDATAFSSLAADTTHQIVKQGLLLDPLTFTCAAPLTVGQSINYLVEVAQSDVDGNPVVLPYFNPSNPSVAWSGPSGAGTTNNTNRASKAIVQIKAGTSATTGTQTTPAPDAGFTGMFVVTVAYGQTTITSTSIATLATAPFILAKLPQIPAAFQNSNWTYCADTGTVNNLVCNPVPALTAYTAGLNMQIKAAFANTGAAVVNFSGLGNKPIVYSNGAALTGADFAAGAVLDLEFDGTSFQLGGGVTNASYPSTALLHSGTDTGSANAYVLTTVAPAVAALVSGQIFEFTPAFSATGASTLAIASFGTKNLMAPGPVGIVKGQITAGVPVLAIYDGTQFQIISGMTASPTAPPFPGLNINGLLLSAMAGTSATATMTIGVGSASNNLGTQSVSVTSPLSWAVTNGNAANGYQGGATLPNSSTIYMYVIWGASGIASFASVLLAPTLPSGYSFYRQVAAFYTDGSGNPIPITTTEGQGGSLVCYLNTPVLDANGVAIPFSARGLVTVSVPSGIPVEWIGSTSISAAAGTAIFVRISSPSETDVSPSLTSAPIADMFIASSGIPGTEVNRHPLITNTSAQLAIRASTTGVTIYIATSGWIHYRRI